MVEKGTWKFDDSVAARFDHEAHTHIPHYEDVINKCLSVAHAAFPDKKAKIIDVGSATGYTLERFRNAGFSNVFGVDSSEAMLANSRVRENLIHSYDFPVAHGPFDLVIANWTLHFIPERKAYIETIRSALRKDGMLIISDKMETHSFVHERYHDFKRSMGISDEEIQRKAASIQGILVPFPLEWYQETLREIGFSHVEIIDASWCFKTILCFA